MSNYIKKTVKRFITTHKIKAISYDTLKNTVINIGYTIVEFNNVFNDENVDTIVHNLKLEKAINNSRGFTYVDNNYRLIFINEDLSEYEKLLVLSHELGHIECEHFSAGNIIGKDIKEEHEANEFLHYLLNPTVKQKMEYFVFLHKKPFIIICTFLIVFIMVITSICISQREQTYYDDFYITTSGSKYHKKDCIFIKGKNNAKRLTKEEFYSGNYEACDMCLPDKR